MDVGSGSGTRRRWIVGQLVLQQDGIIMLVNNEKELHVGSRHCGNL